MTGAWNDAARTLAPHFETARFELRFSLTGEAAVRALAPAGPVARRHAEPPDPPAPWSARAACGEAVGWLLAERAPAGEEVVRDVLQRAVDRHSSLLLQRIAAQSGAMAADLLETVTHRLRTDIGALVVIAEAVLAAPLEEDERTRVRAEVGEVGAEAQRRLSAAREVMTSLQPGAAREPEDLVGTLEREFEGAGVEVGIESVAGGERPVVLVPGAGWAACARLLAADRRLAGPIAVRAHPDGWRVSAGGEGAAGSPVEWTERTLGELAHAGAIAVSAGGSASAREHEGRLAVELTLPAAPSR
jgi:signal transduction histidine kinase